MERRHGSGTYVTKKDVQHETKGLSGFTELMREQGRSLTSEVLEFRTMPAPPAIASQLRIKVNEPVYFSNRVRSVDGRALLVEESYMPVRLFRTLSVAHLEGSKFAYIENECQLPIAGNYESFSAVLADRRMAALLHIEQGRPSCGSPRSHTVRTASFSTTPSCSAMPTTITSTTTCAAPAASLPHLAAYANPSPARGFC